MHVCGKPWGREGISPLPPPPNSSPNVCKSSIQVEIEKSERRDVRGRGEKEKEVREETET